MKTKNALIYFSLILFTFSCSTEKEEPEPQLSVEQVMVAKSPWTFDHYEILEIDYANSSFDENDIYDDMESRYEGHQLTFNEDGTGFNTSGEVGKQTWNWKVENDTLILIQENSEDARVKINKASDSELILKVQSSTYDSKENVRVYHTGNFYYK